MHNLLHRAARSTLAVGAALVFVAALGAASKANAATMGVHLASVHAPARDGQNNTNPGLSFTSDSGLAVGLYLNTQRKLSPYFGKQFELATGRYGSVDVLAGVVGGYQRKCTDFMVQTGSYTTVEKRDDGSTVTSKWPVLEQRQSCSGFSRGYFTPMAAPSYRAPFSVGGATPRVTYMTNFRRHLVHLSANWSY